MGSIIAKTWIYATVRIENEWHERGTGFLVARETGTGQGQIFLCTNKHVLNKNKEMRDSAKEIICLLNAKEEDKIVSKSFTLGLATQNGEKRWREHPEENVDVLVFNVTDLITTHPEIEKKWANYSLFADSSIISSQEITIGEDVLVVGYPLGKKQGENNFPIVRNGLIATQIGQPFIEEVMDKTKKIVKKKYMGFLVDGGVIPGSSGSPVILKPLPGRLVGNSIMLGLPQPYLLGIIAETRFSPIQINDEVSIPSYAGLGLAFDASTIKETIELFF